MQISAFNVEYSSFDFKKTLSGDEISLRMFDNLEKDVTIKEVEVIFQKNLH